MADYGILRRYNDRDLDSLKRPTYVSYASTSGTPPIHYDYSNFNDYALRGATTGDRPFHYDYSRDYSGYSEPSLQRAPAHNRYFPASDSGYMPWIERQLRRMEKYVCYIWISSFLGNCQKGTNPTWDDVLFES